MDGGMVRWMNIHRWTNENGGFAEKYINNNSQSIYNVLTNIIVN